MSRGDLGGRKQEIALEENEMTYRKFRSSAKGADRKADHVIQGQWGEGKDFIHWDFPKILEGGVSGILKHSRIGIQRLGDLTKKELGIQTEVSGLGKKMHLGTER